MDLHVTSNGRPLVDTLLPFSRIPLAVEQCQALIQATLDPTTRCAANGDCTGLNCDLDSTSADEFDVVFAVNKCVDPVVVNVTVFHGGASLFPLVHSNVVNLGGGELLAVDLARNATDLSLTVSEPLLYGH